MNVPTGSWPFPQNVKRLYLKFRLGTYVLPAPNSQPHDDVVSDKVYNVVVNDKFTSVQVA